MEICLFLTFAARPVLKTHVIDHVNALLAEGVAVVLIVNTPCSAKDFVFEGAFATRLSGCFVRENLGFDFAAWAQVYSLIDISPACRRLYLVNDSIIGPLRSEPFKRMIANIRSAAGDLLSLTANSVPIPHLQSYFLVIAGSLLRSSTFICFMRGVLNLPTKEAVIAHYETQLTRFLRAQGFRCDALFPTFADDGVRTDDTVFNWARLIDAGFPFIKAKVLEVSLDTPEVRQRIPDRYLDQLGVVSRGSLS